MVTTVTVLFSERQPGKPEVGMGDGQQASSQEEQRSLRGEAISRVLMEPELWEQRGPRQSAPTPLHHKSRQVQSPLGSPPCQAGIMAKGKDRTAPLIITSQLIGHVQGHVGPAAILSSVPQVTTGPATQHRRHNNYPQADNSQAIVGKEAMTPNQLTATASRARCPKGTHDPPVSYPRVAP